MIVEGSSIPGVKLLSWPVHADERGYFVRTFDPADIRDAGLDPGRFVQNSHSRSSRGVIRGLHTRVPPGEGKLVNCLAGRMFDVVVDVRPHSPTFLQSQSFLLGDDPGTSLYIPAGLAHGWQALTDTVDVSYWIDGPHEPGSDATIRWDDPELAIPWPLEPGPMSSRDRSAPLLGQLLDEIRSWEFR